MATVDTRNLYTATTVIYSGDAALTKDLNAVSRELGNNLQSVFEKGGADLRYGSYIDTQIESEQELADDDGTDVFFAFAEDIDSMEDVHDAAIRLVEETRIPAVYLISANNIRGRLEWFYNKCVKAPYPLPNGLFHEQLTIAQFVSTLNLQELGGDSDSILDILISIAKKTVENRGTLENLGII